MPRTGQFILVLLLVILSCTAPAAAGEIHSGLCDLVLAQERDELDDTELEVGLARAEVTASRKIFELVDKLWSSDAIERLLYLTAKHDRDVAVLNHERTRLRVKRQQAVVAQYDAVCAELGGKAREADRDRAAQAFGLYEESHCGVLAKNLAIAGVDLEYLKEVRASVLDLRNSNVGTVQQVVHAERDVARAAERIERLAPRVDRCAE
ncbi:MAG: hypothetical protein GY716_07860 [bacterium]|nr:hypothetical protein [bacterium]